MCIDISVAVERRTNPKVQTFSMSVQNNLCIDAKQILQMFNARNWRLPLLPDICSCLNYVPNLDVIQTFSEVWII